MAWGVRLGVAFGLGFFVVALAIYLITGGESFEANDVTMAGVLLIYVGGGASAGLVVGACRDMRKGPVLKILVAFLAAAPVSFGTIALLKGWDWRAVDPLAFLVITVMTGLGAAGVFWDDY